MGCAKRELSRPFWRSSSPVRAALLSACFLVDSFHASPLLFSRPLDFWQRNCVVRREWFEGGRRDGIMHSAEPIRVGDSTQVRSYLQMLL
jgi:hypothetical protein